MSCKKFKNGHKIKTLSQRYFQTEEKSVILNYYSNLLTVYKDGGYAFVSPLCAKVKSYYPLLGAL